MAALAAAGNDIEALEQAIKAASHLDEKPGDDRQKLRGKRFVDGLRERRGACGCTGLETIPIGMQRRAQS